MTMAGNDLSKWQGGIDWAEAKSQTGFAMVKATQGTSEVDERYGANIAALRAAGEHRGSYHYPDGGDPVSEADFYVFHAARQNGEMQALDFEGAIETVTDPVGWVVRWMQRVIDRTDNIPLLYMSASCESRWDWSRVIALNCGLWVAAWQGSKPSPGPWPFLIMWQRSDDGQLAGVHGAVDQDVFYGDAQVWAKYANNRSTPGPAAPPVAPPVAPKPPAPPEPPPAPTGLYTVQQGDNLTEIGQRFGASVGELVAWNRDRYPTLGWNRNLIKVGWQLVVHPAGHDQIAYYTVAQDDNLSAIADAHHTTVAQLVAWNEHAYPTLAANPNLIQPGWHLRVG